MEISLSFGFFLSFGCDARQEGKSILFERQRSSRLERWRRRRLLKGTRETASRDGALSRKSGDSRVCESRRRRVVLARTRRRRARTRRCRRAWDLPRGKMRHISKAPRSSRDPSLRARERERAFSHQKPRISESSGRVFILSAGNKRATPRSRMRSMPKTRGSRLLEKASTPRQSEPPKR